MSIQALLAAKLSCRAIDWQLNFYHSSVSCEVKRAKSGANASAASYRVGRAQARSAARRVAAGVARRKLSINVKSPLWRTVVDVLRCHWSPEQIAGKLPRMNTAATPLPAQFDNKLCLSRDELMRHLRHAARYAAQRVGEPAAQEPQDASAARQRQRRPRRWAAQHDLDLPAARRGRRAHRFGAFVERPHQGRDEPMLGGNLGRAHQPLCHARLTQRRVRNRFPRQLQTPGQIRPAEPA